MAFKMYSLEKSMKISSLAEDFKGAPREKDLLEVFYRKKTFNRSYIESYSREKKMILKGILQKEHLTRLAYTFSIEKCLEKVFLRCLQKSLIRDSIETKTLEN